MQNARIAEKSHSATVKLKKNLAIGTMEPFRSRGAGNAEQLKEEKKTVVIHCVNGTAKRIAVLDLIAHAKTINITTN